MPTSSIIPITTIRYYSAGGWPVLMSAESPGATPIVCCRLPTMSGISC